MWNYRIVRHRVGKGLTWYGLHEVYYKKNGKIDLWAPRPDAVGDDVWDMIGGLAVQLRDATKDTPILEEKDLPGKTKRMTTCEHCGHKLKPLPRKKKD